MAFAPAAMPDDITNDMTQALITAEHIVVMRSGQAVLDDVSFSLGPREFVTIIGPNGAGKTVLLHALMGFFAPDKGRIIRQPGIRIGYVPQRLIPDATLPITVTRFLQLVKGATAASIRESLETVQAGDIGGRQLHVLSGGELQRVLLARALLHRPQLLVLDEPAQNLDISGQLAFYKLLETVYREREMSILMVSHDLHMVMASTSRVLCLFHHICCSGEPSVVTRDPQFAALFGADMARMMAVYHHVHSHSHEEPHAPHAH
jgi:zinc transport system ATP-binding protein